MKQEIVWFLLFYKAFFKNPGYCHCKAAKWVTLCLIHKVLYLFFIVSGLFYITLKASEREWKKAIVNCLTIWPNSKGF